jgi:hypothetical protein
MLEHGLMRLANDKLTVVVATPLFAAVTVVVPDGAAVTVAMPLGLTVVVLRGVSIGAS